MDIDHFSKDIFLRNGTMVHLRVIRPDDKQRLLDAFHRAPRESIYSRFLGSKQELSDEELKYLTEIDYEHHMAIGLEVNEEGAKKPIGIGRYVETTEPGAMRVAEIAFIVDQGYQNLGVGTLLFNQLVLIAQQSGITYLVADVLLTNTSMLRILKRSGFKLKSKEIAGVAHIEFNIIQV